MSQPTTLKDLVCERLVNPIGLDEPIPRLGWQLATDRVGARQVAYRIVADGVWDSGWVESDQTVDVEYAGSALVSRQQVTWRVSVRDELGAETTSESATWEMGLLGPSDWSAKWIGGGLNGGPRTSAPSPFLRREFAVGKPVKSARLYVTALGLYEAQLNGQKVGDQELAPGWTDYGTRVRYQVYDVTSFVTDGTNALGAVLGDGWYCGNVEWRGRQLYGDRPRLLAQLVIDHEDGSSTSVVTDGGWKVAYGPLLQADTVMGEHVDARLDLGAWSQPGYDESAWTGADVFESPDIKVVAQASPPIRVTQSLKPVGPPRSFPRWPSPDLVFDFGQNLVGRLRIRLKGPAGCTVKVRYSEWQLDDGRIYTENLRSAQQTDYFTLKGDPDGEVFETRFTFHGFRYAEVTHGPMAWTEAPTADDLTALVMHSDYGLVGEFECSDPLVNQLHRNTQWGWRGNSLDVPTDCPQRDERLGWTGDAQVFARTAMFLSDATTFFEKYQQDLEDSQNELGSIPPTAPNTNAVGGDGGPAWADAFVICPWTVYLTTGDTRILKKHYPAMCRFVEYLAQCSKDDIRSYPGFGGFAGFGDWLSINADTPIDLIGTAFYAYSADLLARIAKVIGEDPAPHEATFERVRMAFRNRYITPDGCVASGTQTAYLLALHFKLMPAEMESAAVDNLVYDIRRRGNKLSTGFVGSPYLNHVLSQHGRDDVAFDLLAQKQWPSWLYAVTLGATTIWERWDGWTKEKGFQDAGMNSFNHYAYGAIMAWLYQCVAGIDLDEANPGYKRIIMRPRLGYLTSAKAHYDSVHGRISSGWAVVDGVFTWDIKIPPNTSAVLHMPTSEGVELPDGVIESSEGLFVLAGTYRLRGRVG